MIETVVYFEKDLRNVTELYYKVILTALKKNNAMIKAFKDCRDKKVLEEPKSVYFFITTLKDFLHLYFKGYRNFIYWFQGIEPEERNLFKQNSLKFFVFFFIVKLALRVCNYKIGISKYIFEHYKKKYNLSFGKEECFVMPCFNSLLNKESFFCKGKYEKNTFCYAGGMQPWQGVEYVFRIYEQIESKFKDSVNLKIFSKDKEATKELVSKYKITNYTLQSIPQEKMDNALSTCKYGFIIRDNDIINNVATPTKLSAYMANGVIPIVSSTVKSFKDLAEGKEYFCCMNDTNDLSTIENLMIKEIKAEDVYKEYSDVFEDYYGINKYVSDLQNYFSR